jgi:hypothetical protein
MTRWPWVTGVLVAFGAAHPMTHDIFHAAFISYERWMQDFSRFVFWCGVGVAALLGFIEWGILTIMVRRRARLVVAGARAQDGELGG